MRAYILMALACFVVTACSGGGSGSGGGAPNKPDNCGATFVDPTPGQQAPEKTSEKTSAACLPDAYKGDPSNLNGTWIGTGSYKLPGGEETAQSYEVVISELPNGFDMKITAKNAEGETELDMGLSGHRIMGNQIFDIRDNANVGQVGSRAFFIGRPELGSLQGSLKPNGSMQLTGEMSYDETQKISYRATLTKQP